MPSPGRGRAEHRPTEASGARTPASASVTRAPKALISPNFGVCTWEWRERPLKVVSGRQKHRESAGGQEGTRAHRGAFTASPSSTTRLPLLLCPPPTLLWGFFPSTHSSNARASSGAPGRGPFALFFFFLLSAFPTRRVLPDTPQPPLQLG